ncbi:MAG: NAD(P)/FAD-dependent oxidoreductase [Acidimicrobiales bacterium]
MTTAATDVVVAGAGPAGTAAAITLARLGRRVIIVDKATFPRDKCCGDGLTVAALRRLERLGLDPSAVPSWEQVGAAVVAVPGARQVRLPLPDGGAQFAASARRADLDSALVDLAASYGAHVIQGQAVVDVQPISATPATRSGAPPEAPPGVAVDLGDGGRIFAHYVIAADGAWSPVRKSLGLGDSGYLGDWQAGRQYFSGVGPEARQLWVWFEPDMLPGYAWSFPLPGGCANVGYGVIRRDGVPLGELKGQRVDLQARPHIRDVLGPDATPSGPWRAWPIPARIGGTPLAGLGGRVLFAGDAARACDPMTGEGIAQALETGEMAARAAAGAGPANPAVAATRYGRQVRWGMAVDDRLARTLSAVLARPRGPNGSLRIADGTGWGRRNFARWMFEDYPRAVLATPHRWHRGMFGRPGAYGPG